MERTGGVIDRKDGAPQGSKWKSAADDGLLMVDRLRKGDIETVI